MKKTLAAATVAALVGVAGAANAADLYKGGSLKDAPAYVPPPTWTGFYIGAHVGGFWADINNHNVDDFLGTTDLGITRMTASSAAARLAITTRPAHSCSVSKPISAARA